MTIRLAQDKDLAEIKNLLFQVNNVHAEGRPDIFIKNARKYKDEEILAQLHDNCKIIFAYTDESDKLIGYAFCQIQLHENITNMHNQNTVYRRFVRGRKAPPQAYRPKLASTCRKMG